MPENAARSFRSVHEEAVARLVEDGVLRTEGDGLRATRRWYGAMARAAARLIAVDDEGADLRVPIADALVELYGLDLPDELLADMIEVLLPIESIDLPAPETRPLPRPHPAVR